jgi:uncharacterized membrane protein
MSATLDMLAEVPLFETMDDTERESLCQLLETRRYDKGETIFRAGDVGDSFYIVRSGAVQIYIENFEGEKIILRENIPGDVFGDVSMFDGGPRTATAVVTEETEVFFLDKEGLLALVKKHPHSALDLLSVMGKRLRSTNELLRHQVSRNLNVEEEERLTFGERIADKVAEFGGSWTFIICFGVTMGLWMGMNFFLREKAWDQYPFILLNLMLSTLAALQAPVIMMSQNRQSAKDRLKADLDYEVNMKAELEVAQLHSKVDLIYEEMQAHFDKLERSVSAK